MKAPRNYSEWVSVLEALKAHTSDEEVWEAMQDGTLAWQEGVAQRFTQRLVNAVNSRLNDATDTFQKQLKHGSTPQSTIQALLQLRREFVFLEKIMDLPAIPEDQRQKYVQLVRDQADKVQKSLEDSARADRTGRLASIVRNHPVNR